MAEEIQEHDLCENQDCEICQENDGAVWASFAGRWLDRGGAVWSEWYGDYLPVNSAVWSRWHRAYILTDEVVYSQWFDTNIHQDEAVVCRFLGDYVPGDSDGVVWSETSDDYVVIEHDRAVWSESLDEYVWQDDLPYCSECGEYDNDNDNDNDGADAIYEFVYSDGSRDMLCESCLPAGVRQLECGDASKARNNGVYAVCASASNVVSTPFGMALRDDCRLLNADTLLWVPKEHATRVYTGDGRSVDTVHPLSVNLGIVPRAWVLNDAYRSVKVVSRHQDTIRVFTGASIEDEFVVPITASDIVMTTPLRLSTLIFNVYEYNGELYAVDVDDAFDWARQHQGARYIPVSQLRNDGAPSTPAVTPEFLSAVDNALWRSAPYSHSWRLRAEELAEVAQSETCRAVLNLQNYSDSLDYEVIGDGEMSFGLELEFDYISKGKAVRAIAAAASDWDGGPLFGVKPDSSTYGGCEVITQPFTASGYVEIRPILKAAIDAIVEAGGVAAGGAGLHVHMGGVHVNLRQTATMLSVLSGTGGHWLARNVGRKSDSQMNNYAQLPSVMQCATLAAEGITNDAKKSALGRYSAVNVQPWPKTVEFRLFDAATCIEHVDLALEFVDALYAYSRKREPRHASAWDFVQFAKHGDWATLNQVLSNF